MLPHVRHQEGTKTIRYVVTINYRPERASAPWSAPWSREESFSTWGQLQEFFKGLAKKAVERGHHQIISFEVLEVAETNTAQLVLQQYIQSCQEELQSQERSLATAREQMLLAEIEVCTDNLS